MTVHPHAAFGTLGAAAGHRTAAQPERRAACSRTIIGRRQHGVRRALTIMRSTARWCAICGPRLSAWTGMRAADLAPLGLGGIAESTYDVFVGCFGTRADPPALTAQLGERWAIASGYHKLFACCQYAHSAVEASLALGEKLAGSGRTSDDIAEIISGNASARPHADRDGSADRPRGEVLDAACNGGRRGARVLAGRPPSRATRSTIRRSRALRHAVRAAALHADRPMAERSPRPRDAGVCPTANVWSEAVEQCARRRRPAVLDATNCSARSTN